MGNYVDKNYSNYLACGEKSVWMDRFIWCRNGKDPKGTTSITEFNKATSAFANMKDVYNVDDLQKEVSSLAEKYVEWVKTFPNTGYVAEDYNDMRNFFIGAIGEYFFYKLMSEARYILAPNNIGELVDYNFHRVSPTLKQSDDFGVDVYFYANDIPCVGQVKFWNRFSKHEPGIKVIQGACSEGVMGGSLDPNHENNVFVFFLGDERSMYSHLAKDWSKYRKHVVPIGKTAMDWTVNGKNKMFWDSFKKSLNELK